jgi:RNA polymerase sigma-70 factor (ECF subfamily)
MEKAFIDMINDHRGILYKVCNLYCTDKTDKEDLFQDIVIQLWKSFPSFRHESKISTWMYRVALNTAISYFRKEIKKPKKLSISDVEFQIPAITDFPDDHDELKFLNDAIQRLTKIEKALIMLYLEEKSYREISEVLGISNSNVGVKLNRIKLKLEKIIKAISYEHR